MDNSPNGEGIAQALILLLALSVVFFPIAILIYFLCKGDKMKFLKVELFDKQDQDQPVEFKAVYTEPKRDFFIELEKLAKKHNVYDLRITEEEEDQ